MQVPVVIYEQIEQAIINRLHQGLGNMVRQVVSYSGELDDDLGAVVRALPAVWVTFAGIQTSKPIATNQHKLLCTGTFVVMVANQNVRSDVASRHTKHVGEIGTNTLVWAVRRLLAHQDLGLPIKHLQPTRVRSLFNVSLKNQAISGYACEFETEWLEEVLKNKTWPVPQEHDTDGLYQVYQGRVDKPADDLLRIQLSVSDANTHKQLDGTVTLRNEDD